MRWVGQKENKNNCVREHPRFCGVNAGEAYPSANLWVAGFHFVLQTPRLQAGEFNIAVDRMIITSTLREVQAELLKILKYGSS
jgi:hypothetical protein